MIVLVGASASGKTELARKLYQTFGYQKCITTTTRKPRINEIDGKDYHFLTEEKFKHLQEQNAFFEVTNYNGHHYGIQKNDVNINGVVIVDPNGANKLIEKASDQVFVVYVETTPEVRMKRMLQRGDSMEATQKRLDQDAFVFNKTKFMRIDLLLKNEEHTLDELAKTLHLSYQDYLNYQDSRKKI